MGERDEYVDIPKERWQRWRQAANAMGLEGIALAHAIALAQRESTPSNLGRCALAARRAENVTTRDAQMVANAVATEIEDAILA